MAHTDPQSWPYCHLYGVYGCIWYIQTPEQAPLPCIWCIWHIQTPEQAPLPCIWCIWHIQNPRAGPTALYMVYMAVYGIYRLPEVAPLPFIWLYMLYMAYTDTQSLPHCPVYGVYSCVCCICHIQTPRACPIAMYMAVYTHPYRNIYSWGHVYCTPRKSRYSRLFPNVEALKPERKLIADVAKDYMFSQNRPTGNLAKASRFNRRKSGE